MNDADERQVHWCRIVMNRATRQLVGALNHQDMTVLEISGNMWRDFPFKAYGAVQYPQYDICESVIGLRDGDKVRFFDMVIAEQVLEHVRYPYRAVKNVHQMLNPGGYFLVTTPFLIRVHGCPHDYTRWTEDGLRYLLNEGGFSLENIQTGAWGNKDCIVGNFYDWPFYDPERHSLDNEPDIPMVVWALARKNP